MLIYSFSAIYNFPFFFNYHELGSMACSDPELILKMWCLICGIFNSILYCYFVYLLCHSHK
jgi:hypothetical protein